MSTPFLEPFGGPKKNNLYAELPQTGGVTKHCKTIHSVIKVRLCAVNKILPIFPHSFLFVFPFYVPFFGLPWKPFIQNTFSILPYFISIGHVFLYLEYLSLLRLARNKDSTCARMLHYHDI